MSFLPLYPRLPHSEGGNRGRFLQKFHAHLARKSLKQALLTIFGQQKEDARPFPAPTALRSGGNCLCPTSGICSKFLLLPVSHQRVPKRDGSSAVMAALWQSSGIRICGGSSLPLCRKRGCEGVSRATHTGWSEGGLATVIRQWHLPLPPPR